MKKMVFKLFPLVVHMSPLWWDLHLLTFWCPWYPWILCKGPTWPEKNKINFILFIFFILTQMVLIRLFLYLTCKTWVRGKAPPGPPKYEKKYYFFHILGLNLKMPYQIASLFHMYIDMGERIAGKQDRFSLIIEDPLRAPKIPPK